MGLALPAFWEENNMGKRKIYYKVLSEDRKSVVMNNYGPANTRIHYPIGKWTRPKIKGSKLFVFSNEQQDFI